MPVNKKILLIAHFCGDFDNEDNSRFNYLATLLVQNENDVEIVTSEFSHKGRRQKERNASQRPFKITLLKEPGYSSSVSLRRLYSHFIWGINLRKYLSEIDKPDVVYCAVPSLTGALSAADYCRRNKIKFVIDIQDLWPEAFKMVFNIPVISNIIFSPLTIVANHIYKQADEIFAVSQTFVDRALASNRKCSFGKCVFLGTDFETFLNNAHDNPVTNKGPREFWIGYCGTLGLSYDLKCVMDAMVLMRDQGITVPLFIVMGDGPKKKDFEDYATSKSIPVIFTGWLPYAKMCGMLCACDVVVNPIIAGSAGSIINKHADYAASGLPVINTQECLEYRDLIDKYEMGINCRCESSDDVAKALITLSEDYGLRKQMGKNALRCAMECFDRKRSYQVLAKALESRS